MEHIYKPAHFIHDLQHPYAWPGGYPRYFITSDGAALSFESAKENQELIIDSIKDQCNDDWNVTGCAINWEDADLICDDTGKPIECAYSD